MTDLNKVVATLYQHCETGRTRIVMSGDITDCDAGWLPVDKVIFLSALESAQAEAERLKNELADVLDCKNGIGPTALSTVLKQLSAEQAKVKELVEALKHLLYLGECASAYDKAQAAIAKATGEPT